MKLILDNRTHHLFNENYNEILRRSGMFDIEYQELEEHSRMLEIDKIVYPNGRRAKHGQITFAKIDGKLIVFDTQFNNKFTDLYINNGLLEGFDPSLYVKYNYDLTAPCKLYVWVMFPAGFRLVESFKYQYTSDYTVMASGRTSLRIMSRTNWFNKAKELGIDCKIGIPQEEYIKLLSKSKWGVILSKRNEKNTREYEFISCEMPLALNYEPLYDFPFHPNEHYLKLNSPNDLEQMIKTDPEKYRIQSKILWDNYFRPDKATKMLLKAAGIK